MDLLYSRYASPFEFIRPYIDQGRFGELVSEIINQENERRKEQVEKDEDMKLWLMYLHSFSDKSFIDWKSDVMNASSQKTRKSIKDDELTDDGIKSIYNKFFPS